MNKKKYLLALLDDISTSLHNQVVAAERCEALYKRSIALQEQALRLQTKSTRAAQEVASISKQQYAQRLLTAVRAATETPHE